MYGWYAVTLAAFCAGTIIGGWVMYLIHASRERRRFDAGLDAIERATDERHAAGRHRVSEPRAALPVPPPGDRLMGKQPQPSSPGARDDTRSQSAQGDGSLVIDRAENAIPRAAGAPRTRGAQPPGHRTWTDASHIAPVMWTVPGRPQAAPSKNGADDTRRITRIKLDTASTGEIREIGDRLVAAIERGETP